jgi:beta-lactamase regulating signal transducer with metallopeptidase domain
MINELIFLALRTLCRSELAASAAILLVLAIRRPARRILGAELAYRLWALPLAAALATLFPSLPEMIHGPAAAKQAMATFDPAAGASVVIAWSIGVGLCLGAMSISERRFRRLAARGLAGPAVMGLGWHRLITPADFHIRFNDVERDFILRHERAHIARRDPHANLLIAVLQAISWFNPLAHLAAVFARTDQELACDERVIRHRPDLRRGYAETLLKAQLSAPRSPFACAFAGGRHPLELRLSMLARPQPGVVRYLAGGAAVAALSLLMAAAVWAASPDGRASPALPWDALHAALAGLTASG